MIRQPSRRAVLAVRGVKVAATAAVAGCALVLTLGGATASPGSGSTDGSAALVERYGSDARCSGLAGRTIVRTGDGATRAVSFEQAWRVYRGERPGTLVVVCPD